jgi:nicotinamide mononucleotide adenylyltransferase
MTIAICFGQFGPYHHVRVAALQRAAQVFGDGRWHVSGSANQQSTISNPSTPATRADAIRAAQGTAER